MLGLKDLRAYQYVRTWTAITNKRHALFLGLGTGKTIISLTAIAILDAFGLIDRVLIVAPKSVALTVWHTEAANWSHTRHLDFSLCLGTQTQRLTALERNATVTVINIDNLVWLLKHYKVSRWPFDMVVLDESSLFKNNSSARFKAFRMFTRTERNKRGGGIVKVDSPIKRLLLLTATPASNGLKNLWSQMALLDNGRALFRSFTTFEDVFFRVIPKARKLVPRSGSEERIYEKIRHLVTVLRSKDVIDMKPIIYNTIEVELPPLARTQYEILKKEYLLYLGEDKVKATTEAALQNKLQQLCNGATYVGNPQDYDYKKRWEQVHDTKLLKLEELVESSGEPLLVGYWFQHDKELIVEHLGDRVTTVDKDLSKTVNAWNAGEIDVLLVQIQSMSHGVNLQHGGSTIIFYSLLWDLEVHDQFIGRIYRSGQKNVVTVNYITCANTVENRIAKALSDKADVQNALLDALKE